MPTAPFSRTERRAWLATLLYFLALATAALLAGCAATRPTSFDLGFRRESPVSNHDPRVRHAEPAPSRVR